MFQASVDALGLSAAKGPRVRDGMFHGGRPVLSSLGLQLCLSFNTYFSPFWLVGCAIISGTISEDSAPFGGSLGVILYPILLVLEPIRLYLGWSGNLSETVPALFGFWLATVVFEIPLVILVLLDSPFAMELSLNIVTLLFLVVEAYVGAAAVRDISRAQATTFQMLHDDLEDVAVAEKRFFSESRV